MRASAWKWLLLAIAGLVLAIATLRPNDTSAHAVLERSLPVQNQEIPLAQKPSKVETWYSEALEKSLTQVEVLDTQEQVVSTGPTIFSDDPTYAAVTLPPTLDPGIYTVKFQNVSSVDGHTWAGSFGFIVLEADGSRPPGVLPSASSTSSQGFLPEWGDVVLRWIGILAAVTLVSSSLFAVLIARPAAEFLGKEQKAVVREVSFTQASGLAVVAAPVLIVSVIGQVILLADRVGGSGQIDDILFNTRSGQLWLAQIGISIALLLLFVPAIVSAQFRRSELAALALYPALIGELGLLMTASLGSHAATGGGQFWSISSDFVHYLATAAWLGSLAQLVIVFWWTQRRIDDPDRLLYRANVLDRFSWTAVVSVIVLIGTGTFNAFVRLPTFQALYETTYGRVLIAKLALIIPLLLVAGLNAFVLKPRLVDAIDTLHPEAGRSKPKGRHRPAVQERLGQLQRLAPRMFIIELALGIAVLASVAVLTQTTTAEGELRLDAGKPSGEFAATATAADLGGHLQIKPFGVGVSTFTMSFTSQTGEAVDNIEGVRLRAFYDDPNVAPSAGISGTDQDLQATDDPAVWSADSALLTQPGDWRLQARIRRAGADDAQMTYTVPRVGGILARGRGPEDLFDLPFTYVGWNIVAGGAMIVLGIGALLIWRNRPQSWHTATSASVAFSSLIALMAGATLLFGVHGHSGEGTVKNPIPMSPESVAAGYNTFVSNCASCHGFDLRGNSTAADLTVHVPAHNDGTLFLWISEGLPLNSTRKTMPSWKDRLSETERWNVINYLRNAIDTGELQPAGAGTPGGQTPTP